MSKTKRKNILKEQGVTSDLAKKFVEGIMKSKGVKIRKKK